MAKLIHLLDKKVAELIAAGEVVERPSSVVKELVENCIDAGATAVTVEIKNGGVRYIRVTDNGCGISREDVPTAFLRHATSKVEREADLDAIATLGFRGEALASIAAVAHVELITRTREETVGTRYCIDGGEETLLEDAGCPKGTTLLVRDLFYNTPARMKFLKKDVSEANAVAAAVDRIALSHPEVSVRFIRDGKQERMTPGDGKLLSAIHAVFGRQFAQSLLPVDYTLNGVKVSGFVSKPSASRPNRSMQSFFINGRYVRTRTAAVALEEAYKGSIMVGKFPACVLNIQLNLSMVDVNVHPAKIEVRFVNERPIFDAVYHGCKNALGTDQPAQEIDLSKAARVIRTPSAEAAQQLTLPSPPSPPSRQAPPAAAAGAFGRAVLQAPADIPYAPSPTVSIPVTPWPQEPPVSPKGPPKEAPWALAAERPPVPFALKEEKKEGFPAKPSPTAEAPAPSGTRQGQPVSSALLSQEVRLIGEAFSTYILLECGEELLLIDKHAAHERLLYERIKAQAELTPQLLLAPVTVTLDRESYAAVLQNLATLSSLGFETEDFGAGAVLVRTAPLQMDGQDAGDLVAEIAGKLLKSARDLTPERLEWVYHSVACRAAVKAGDHSSPRELYDLARRTLEEEVRHCPHGRPVAMRLTKKQLEKQFGRIQ